VNDKTTRRVLILFLLIIAVFVAVAVLSVRNINRSVAASDWVNHTHAVILETEGLRSALYVGDGASHAYVVTGDARDKRSCVEALSDVDEHLQILAALTRTEPSQKEQVARIAVLVNRRSDFIRGVVAARQAAGPEAVRSMLAEDAGQPALKGIQGAVDKLKDDELGLLTERDTASFLQAQTVRWTVWTGVTLDFLLLAGTGWLVIVDIGARRRAAAVLTEANERQEAKVLERTAELASANGLLTTENLERRWANQGLEHQLRYNQLIINSINDLVFVITKATNISRVNPAVVRLTGHETHELIHVPFSSIARITGEGAPAMIDPIPQAMNAGHDLREQRAVIVDKLGREIPVRMALFPLRDRDKVVGGVVILQVVPSAETGKT
jgi:PAS domain S-box-containing protein